MRSTNAPDFFHRNRNLSTDYSIEIWKVPTPLHQDHPRRVHRRKRADRWLPTLCSAGNQTQAHPLSSLRGPRPGAHPWRPRPAWRGRAPQCEQSIRRPPWRRPCLRSGGHPRPQTAAKIGTQGQGPRYRPAQALPARPRKLGPAVLPPPMVQECLSKRRSAMATPIF